MCEHVWIFYYWFKKKLLLFGFFLYICKIFTILIALLKIKGEYPLFYNNSLCQHIDLCTYNKITLNRCLVTCVFHKRLPIVSYGIVLSYGSRNIYTNALPSVFKFPYSYKLFESSLFSFIFTSVPFPLFLFFI